MIVALVGRSGAGKTWVLERLIPLLRARGLSVAALKHTHHELWADRPDSDTARLRAAGAHPVGIAGPGGHTWYDLEAEWPAADVVLLEGFKGRPGIRKIEVLRGQAPLLQADQLWATVGDARPPLRHYGWNELERLAADLEPADPVFLEVDGVPVECPPDLSAFLRERWPTGRLRLLRASRSG